MHIYIYIYIICIPNIYIYIYIYICIYRRALRMAPPFFRDFKDTVSPFHAWFDTTRYIYGLIIFVFLFLGIGPPKQYLLTSILGIPLIFRGTVQGSGISRVMPAVFALACPCSRYSVSALRLAPDRGAFPKVRSLGRPNALDMFFPGRYRKSGEVPRTSASARGISYCTISDSGRRYRKQLVIVLRIARCILSNLCKCPCRPSIYIYIYM